MNSDLKILDPVQPVDVAGERLEVRELSWIDALDFVGKLGGLLDRFIDQESGKLVFSQDQMGRVIGQSGELATDLILKATGKPPDWIEGLRTSEALSVLAAAIQVNLHPELLGKCRGVARAVTGVLGPVKVTSEPSISSSAKATPSTPSGA